MTCENLYCFFASKLNNVSSVLSSLFIQLLKIEALAFKCHVSHFNILILYVFVYKEVDSTKVQEKCMQDSPS